VWTIEEAGGKPKKEAAARRIAVKRRRALASKFDTSKFPDTSITYQRYDGIKLPSYRGCGNAL
jgi:hypothetical protein